VTVGVAALLDDVLQLSGDALRLWIAAALTPEAEVGQPASGALEVGCDVGV